MRNLLMSYAVLMFLTPGSLFGADQILLVQSRDDYLATAAGKVESALSGSFNLVKLKKLRDTNEIAGVIENLGPKAIVIFEKHAKGSSLHWFKEYLRAHAARYSATAFIFVKDYFIDPSEIYMDNATGICFLPPVIFGVEKLQERLGREIRSVGIVYPRALRKMIMDNSASCVQKGISLTMKIVPDRNAPTFVNALDDALNDLKKQNVDALWIMEDESLLQLPLVRDVWGPFLKKNAIPVIVNNDAFLSDPWNIGTVCVVPGADQLSGAIAEKIRELQRSSWIVENPCIEPLAAYSDQIKKVPLARNTALSARHARQEAQPAPFPEPARQLQPAAPVVPVQAPPSAETKSPAATGVAQPAAATVPQEIAAPATVKAAPVDNQNPRAAIARQEFLPPAAAAKSHQFAKAEPLPKAAKSAKTPRPPQAKEGGQSQLPPVLDPPVLERGQEATQATPEEKIIGYAAVIASHTAVTKGAEDNAAIIGWALNGQQFPVYEEKNNKLWIAFFNAFGWIAAKDAKMLQETPPAAVQSAEAPPERNSQSWRIIFVLCAAAAAMIAAFFIAKKAFGRAAGSGGAKKKCLLLARKGAQSENGAAIKGILVKSGYTVLSFTSLQRAAQCIRHEQLDFIFIDWYLDTNIEDKLTRLLRGGFHEHAARIVFYDVAEKARSAGSRVIKNSVLLGSDFTALDIYHIVTAQGQSASPDFEQ